MFTVATAIRDLGAKFARAVTESPLLCARLLVCKVCGLSRERLAMHPETLLDPGQSEELARLAARRLSGEPLAYILGQREFFGRDFLLDRSTLIPRPETELLLETALGLTGLPGLPVPPADPGQNAGKSQGAARVRFLDAGTGSGCIGISLALERPAWQGILLDISSAALGIAGKNAKALGCAERLAILRADMATLPLPDHCLSIIVANPPYIASSELDQVMPDVLAFEPTEALFSPEQGLAHSRALAREAARILLPGGWLLLEHGASQGPAVRELLAGSGFAQVRTCRDLAGLERCSLGQMPLRQARPPAVQP